MKDHTSTGENDIIDIIEKLIKIIKSEKARSQQKPAIDEIVRLYETEADKVILKGIEREGLFYIAGKIFAEVSSNVISYRVGMEAYFQKANGEWIVKSNHTKWWELDDLLLDSRSELKQKRRIEFELTLPSRG